MSFSERALASYSKEALAEFYLAASQLLTGWKAFKDLYDMGDQEATHVMTAWQRVEQGVPAGDRG